VLEVRHVVLDELEVRHVLEVQQVVLVLVVLDELEVRYVLEVQQVVLVLVAAHLAVLA